MQFDDEFMKEAELALEISQIKAVFDHWEKIGLGSDFSKPGGYQCYKQLWRCVEKNTPAHLKEFERRFGHYVDMSEAMAEINVNDLVAELGKVADEKGKK